MKCSGIYKDVVVDNKTIRARAGCGYDMTDILYSIPGDGNVHMYKCPKCGNVGTARRVSRDKLDRLTSQGAN